MSAVCYGFFNQVEVEVEVEVEVTLQLTVSQSVCQGIEPTLET
jgi:hypothetical protein